MKSEKIVNGLIVILVLIFAIQALQFIVTDSVELARLAPLSYAQKLDLLDGNYYHVFFYRYYVWLNSIIPPARSFSMLFDGSDKTSYLRYEHKLDYYLYPRYVLPGDEKLSGHIEYSDLVLVLNMKKTAFGTRGDLKFKILNGRTYYLLAALDGKGLLAERAFIQDEVLKKTGWDGLKRDFAGLYGIDITKAAF